MYKIIEDCSPFYIRFTHDGIEEIINYSKKIVDNIKSVNDFTHLKVPINQAKKLISLVPLSKSIPLMEDRVSFFISSPGLYYRAHKDGICDRFGINYTCKILDDKCITNWYSDQDLKNYKIDYLHNYSSRECIDFDKSKHKPIKSMIAKEGECILFNTEIFHDWDNTQSKNLRVILTFRTIKELKAKTYFNDVKKVLFNLL